MKINPTFDKDHYPTEETLDIIKYWSDLSSEGIRKLMDFCYDCWQYPEFFIKEKVKNDLGDSVIQYKISTGGWSGNEDVIQALRENVIFWCLCWVQSRRGGHYLFEVKT